MFFANKTRGLFCTISSDLLFNTTISHHKLNMNVELGPFVFFEPGDGRLNMEEYIQLMEQQKKPEEKEEDIIQAFRVFDSENKGYIDSSELRELLENMDWKVSADDLKDLITSANLHQDRKISLDGRSPARII